MIVSLEWTPDGIRFECRTEAGKGECVYHTIPAAIDAVGELLLAEEESYEYPTAEYPTVSHVRAEKLARAIEEAMGQR